MNIARQKNHTERLLPLEGLRVIAAFAVVIAHWCRVQEQRWDQLLVARVRSRHAGAYIGADTTDLIEPLSIVPRENIVWHVRDAFPDHMQLFELVLSDDALLDGNDVGHFFSGNCHMCGISFCRLPALHSCRSPSHHTLAQISGAEYWERWA